MERHRKATTTTKRLAALAVALLPAMVASTGARAGSGTSADGLITWSTNDTGLTAPGNAVRPTYYNGLDDSGQFATDYLRYGADDSAATAHMGEQQTGSTDLVQTYEGNSKMKTSQYFTPGSSTQTAQSGFYLQGPGTWYFQPNNPGLETAATNLYFFSSAGMSYFGALVNFTGLDTAAIEVYDAKGDVLLNIDPTTQYYQTNTDTSGNTVYSMFLNLTSATSEISQVEFSQTSGRYHAGGPSTMLVSQETESPTAGGTNSIGGGGTADVPEPGLLALGGLAALGAIGSARGLRRRDLTAA